MAHEIETAFFVGTPAWHRLGTVVQDAPTTEDAVRLACLNWLVEERLIAHFTPELVAKEITTHKAIVRATDNRCLGVVGKDYRPLQNERAFRFFDPILAEGHAQLEAAGSLRNGQRVWVLAKLRNASADVVPGDRVDGYLLLSNSHDGSQAVRVQFTAIRVVCMNTLSAAHRRGDEALEQCLRIRHTQGLEASLDAVGRLLDFTGRTFAVSVEAYQALARKRLPVDGLREYVREVFRIPGEELPGSRILKGIQRSYDLGKGAQLPGVHGTYWGAYNSVTEWVGYARGRDEDRRLDSLWFGEGRNIRDRALKVALEAVN